MRPRRPLRRICQSSAQYKPEPLYLCTHRVCVHTICSFSHRGQSAATTPLHKQYNCGGVRARIRLAIRPLFYNVVATIRIDEEQRGGYLPPRFVFPFRYAEGYTLDIADRACDDLWISSEEGKIWVMIRRGLIWVSVFFFLWEREIFFLRWSWIRWYLSNFSWPPGKIQVMDISGKIDEENIIMKLFTFISMQSLA